MVVLFYDSTAIVVDVCGINGLVLRSRLVRCHGDVLFRASWSTDVRLGLVPSLEWPSNVVFLLVTSSEDRFMVSAFKIKRVALKLDGSTYMWALIGGCI